ncbi:MAG TPA: STAS domain-containing protein [Solirubrobacteraceae bacterium]|nr:STAS domain-containing protein [Solirubrobacteraceae bacterium]
MPFPSESGPESQLGTRPLRVELDDLAGQTMCVRVTGELDLATTEELNAQLTEILTSARTVVLDLGGVTFMDSTGLSAILRAVNRAEMIGAELKIASPLPSQPQRLLELTGILERLAFTAVPPRTPA